MDILQSFVFISFALLGVNAQYFLPKNFSNVENPEIPNLENNTVNHHQQYRKSHGVEISNNRLQRDSTVDLISPPPPSSEQPTKGITTNTGNYM